MVGEIENNHLSQCGAEESLTYEPMSDVVLFRQVGTLYLY